MAYKKTVSEKLETKLKVLDNYDQIELINNSYRIGNRIFLKRTDQKLIYGTKRFYPNLMDPIKEDEFSVTINLNHDNLKYINSNPINPPKGAKKIYDVFKNIKGLEVKRIIIGSPENSFQNDVISVTKEMYDQILGIDLEERQEKNVRIFNRMIPFLREEFGINTEDIEVDRNYHLLLNEIIESGEFFSRAVSPLQAGSVAGHGDNSKRSLLT